MAVHGLESMATVVFSIGPPVAVGARAQLLLQRGPTGRGPTAQGEPTVAGGKDRRGVIVVGIDAGHGGAGRGRRDRGRHGGDDGSGQRPDRVAFHGGAQQHPFCQPSRPVVEAAAGEHHGQPLLRKDEEVAGEKEGAAILVPATEPCCVEADLLHRVPAQAPARRCRIGIDARACALVDQSRRCQAEAADARRGMQRWAWDRACGVQRSCWVCAE